MILLSDPCTWNHYGAVNKNNDFFKNVVKLCQKQKGQKFVGMLVFYPFFEFLLAVCWKKRIEESSIPIRICPFIICQGFNYVFTLIFGPLAVKYLIYDWPNPSTFGSSLNLETYHLPATTIYLWTIHANEVSHYLTSQHVVANACIELDISYSI